MRIGFIGVSLLGLLAVALGCGDGSGLGSAPPTANLKAPTEPATAPSAASATVGPVHLEAEEPTTESPTRPSLNLHPEIVIRTSLGDIRIQLDREKAPRTTENFLVNYVEGGWYADTIIHHVQPEKMIIGGGFLVDLEAKLTRTEIRSEANNGLSNRRGTLAMMRHPDYVHSATSRFFINLADNTEFDYSQTDDGSLNGYCVFGKVIGGLEVAEKIASQPTSQRREFARVPDEPVVIRAIEPVELR